MKLADRFLAKFLLLVLPFVLAACGGGGSGGGGPGAGNNEAAPQWIVFRADKQVDEEFALYSTFDNGAGEPRRLSPEKTGVAKFSVSPNGRFVAFTARRDTDNDNDIDFDDGPPELYWVPVDGTTAAINLSGTLPVHAFITEFDWSPNSDKLAYRADIDTDDVDEIYLVTFDQPTPVKINDNVGTTVEMGDILWSPDGRYIAQVVRNRTNRFTIDRMAINVHDAELGTPNSTRITGSLLPGSCFPSTQSCPSSVPSGANIGGIITWAPDSSRLSYYIDDQDADTRIHYQAMPDGNPTRITRPLAADQTGGLRYEWTSNSRYFVYTIRTDTVGVTLVDVFDTTTNSIRNVFTAPNDGVISGLIKPQPGGELFTLQSSRSSAGGNELFLVSPTDDGTIDPLPISAALPADSTITESHWSPDGSRMVYRLLDLNTRTSKYYSVLADASDVPVQVSHDSTGTRQQTIFDWFSGSERILYGLGQGIYAARADQSDTAIALQGNLNHLVEALGGGLFFQSAQLSGRSALPELQRVGMLGERDSDGVSRLYTVRPDASALTDVSGDIVTGGQVTQFAFAAVLDGVAASFTDRDDPRSIALGSGLNVSSIELVSGDDRGVTINTTAGTLDIDPTAYFALNQGEQEVVVFSYELSDFEADTQLATLTFNGTDNVPPVAPPPIVVSFDDKTGFVKVGLLSGASDADGDTLQAQDVVLLRGNDVGVSFNSTDNSLDLNSFVYDFLEQGEREDLDYSYNINDGQGGITQAFATIIIDGTTNQPPTVTGPISFTVSELDGPVTLFLLSSASDPDGDSLQVQNLLLVSGDGSGITFDSNSNALFIDPGAYSALEMGESEIVTYNYQVNDGFGASVMTSVTVTINGAPNQPPTVTGPVLATFSELDSLATLDMLSMASDPDGDTLQVQNAVLASGDDSGVSINLVSNELIVDPSAYGALNPGQTIFIIYNYDIGDGVGNSVSTSVTITINGA